MSPPPDLLGSHSALDPAGPQADRLADLIWINIAVLGVIFVLVVAVALVAAVHRRMRPEDRRDQVLPNEPRRERRLLRAIGVASALSLVTLVGLLVLSISTGKRLSSLKDPHALEIRVTGKQWWWQVEYPDPNPSRSVTTANEIHVPVGRTVKLVLASSDVIHSFWVPALHGKLDLIPGRQNELYLRADRAGTYGGQCAELCGLGHAHMALLVVAEPPHELDAWLERARKPAEAPKDPVALRGRQVFESTSCPMCHNVAGTPASASAGPDLTHFASRRGIAAGSVPNLRGHLGGWILDPQGVKPGAAMPPNALTGPDLTALLAYLETLR